jgi:hypothetical protein
MFPTLGGALDVPPSNPSSFNFGDPELRLIMNVEQLTGGSGFGATIGQKPVLSDFPTSTAAMTLIALPFNVPYDIVSVSVSTVEIDVAPVPEPSTFTLATLLVGSVLPGATWRRRRSFLVDYAARRC